MPWLLEREINGKQGEFVAIGKNLNATTSIGWIKPLDEDVKLALVPHPEGISPKCLTVGGRQPNEISEL